MPEMILRHTLSGPERAEMRKRLFKETYDIQRLHRRAVADYRDACTPISGEAHKIGKRSVTRKPVAPFQRPDNIVKEALYGLVVRVHQTHGWLASLEIFVREHNPKIVHKPRVGDAADWIVRLFNYLSKNKLGPGLKQSHEGLVSKTVMYRWAIEIRFAIKNRIRQGCSSIFIDYVGGHEIISAMEDIDGGYKLDDLAFLSSLQDKQIKDADKEKQLEDQAEARKDLRKSATYTSDYDEWK